MVKYKGTVTIGDRLNSSTWDHVYIKLVGTEGTSERTTLSTGFGYFCSGPVLQFEVNCKTTIGKLLQIELDKKTHLLLPQNAWLPAKVVVDSPEGETYHFPIYHWFTNQDVQTFSEGTAVTVFELDTLPDCVRRTREEELKLRNKQYRLLGLKVKGLADSTEKWKGMDAIRQVFRNKQTTISEHVQQNWRKDSLFGYQFLNGVNPMVIRRCSVLPEYFPVTEDKVFLPGGRSLAEEMKSGRIFLCDYKILDGLKGNTINGNQQYLMAPLVLLHQTPKNRLKPIAIQLTQKPSGDYPIFFPNNSDYDWSLAKMYVKSADFNDHQLNFHFVRSHLLAEVFSVSLLRNLPMVHPLYKYIASGGEAMDMLMQRATESITYTSLCIRDDIKERGLETVDNYYYRDDGIEMWDIINRFVRGVLGYYYKQDSDVKRDTELQTWVADIFEHGFLSRTESGIPKDFNTVDELVKYVTMVIFNVSAQHSAVNTGQFDYCSWMPNSPMSIQQLPPTTTGASDHDRIMNSLPDINATVNVMAVLWVLSNQSSDFVPLGQYPEEHFSELIPCRHIEVFQKELGCLSEKIKDRNKGLKIPYTYLDPELVENSIAI
ncbi:hypothetical protein NHX12_021120 [Muraenolepis orangiensis]|uniref:Hydroperoxide isomerase ALOXE3-like n=1 Tax=Muraenolepis orangiensis TaxID=630683 RepID=A0A9Q0EPW4_9TELE|nr:hypothetical protein NHX12_021120 [Muraenolepis orangiensis]